MELFNERPAMNLLPRWARFENTRAILLFFVGLTSLAILTQTSWNIIQDRRLTLISEQENGLIAARLLDEHAQQQLKVAANGLDLVATRILEVAQRKTLDDTVIHDVIEDAIKNARTVGALQFVNQEGIQWVSTFDFPHFVAASDKRDDIHWLLIHQDYREIFIGVPFHRYIDGEHVLHPGGKGWVNYKWPNPATKKLETKSSYIVKYQDICIGTGIYK